MPDGTSMKDLVARIKVVKDAEERFRMSATPRAGRRHGFLRRHGAVARRLRREAA